MAGESEEDSEKSTMLWSAEIEKAVAEVLEKVRLMYNKICAMDRALEAIPELRTMITAVTVAQATMAKSAESMADTFSKTESRYTRMEERHEELVRLATGKEQMPLRSHYLTIGAMLLPTLVMSIGVIMSILYVTQYDIDVSLSSLKANHNGQGK